MVDNFIQWVAVVIEFLGISLIAIELYFPRAAEGLKRGFEQTKPRVEKRPHIWIGGFILLWIIAVVCLSLFDNTMSLLANVFFSVVTSLIILFMLLSKALVKLGVVLGRGNSVAGVGLVLALIGMSIEIYQLV